MKVLAAYIVSAVLYGLGHAISLALVRAGWLAFLYPIYNRLMLASFDIEEWAGVEFMWRSGGSGIEE